uniref:Intraflagellar transport 74 n=1 Tax=Sphaeramia orbicularis TaxID=375764 RepID=A0A673AI20_9TELE
MASQRPLSGMGRPVSRSGSVVPGAGRPPTAIRPPPTAIRVGTGMVPGTGGHSAMRGGIPIATPGVLSAQIKVTDRPVTQQGLSGMKTGMKGPQRQILDKSYYLDHELTTETSKLHKEIDSYNQENSVYLSYEEEVTEGLAVEIKDLQGQLADYNMYSTLLLFFYPTVCCLCRREEAIRAIEEEIRRERRVADEVVQAMPPAKQEKYFTMTTANEELLQVLLYFDTNIVTASELKNMQEVLVSKETEVVQSESTTRGLSTESQRLQQDLEKVQQLEGKITGELSTLKERVSTMESELHTYRDLDTLKRSAEEKKKRLQEDRVLLTQRQDSFRQLLEEKNQNYDALKTKLQENETHAQLVNLERKWQHLEQNNFVMKEFIASKSQESDYASVAKNVYQQLAEYNKCLIDSLQSNRS